MTRVAYNVAASQAGWFACVIGAANGMPWIGLFAVVLIVAIHLRLARRVGPELRLILSAVVIGLVADSLLVLAGLVRYPSGNWIEGLAPYWILAMWGLFATTLNVSMKWLRNRELLAVLFGAVGGPLAYLAGEKLGAITFVQPPYALVALALIWAFAMPLLVRLAVRMDGMSEITKPDFIHSDWKVSNHA